jgi:alpha-mannosidase
MNPDPQSDRGDHYFTYSLYPHNNNWKDAETITRGLELNNPFAAVDIPEKSGGEVKSSFISVSAANVLLEALKKCEDEDAYILRFVEKTGRRTKTEVSFFADIERMTECNLLEREDVSFDTFENGRIEFEIDPFEIKTFKIFLK